MTGREIADICKAHELCDGCELEEEYEVCKQIMEEMKNGCPATLLDILNGEYRCGAEARPVSRGGRISFFFTLTS